MSEQAADLELFLTCIDCNGRGWVDPYGEALPCRTCHGEGRLESEALLLLSDTLMGQPYFQSLDHYRETFKELHGSLPAEEVR